MEPTVRIKKNMAGEVSLIGNGPGILVAVEEACIAEGYSAVSCHGRLHLLSGYRLSYYNAFLNPLLG